MIKAIYASTQDSDMRYLLGGEVADAAFYIDTGDKKYLFLDQREYGVFVSEHQRNDLEVVLRTPLLKEAQQFPEEVSVTCKLARYIWQQYDLFKESVTVPVSFPLDVADYLRANGATLMPTASFCPERRRKTPDEVAKIRAAIKKTQKAYRHIEEVLRQSAIENDHIIYEEKPLTSEWLKQMVEHVLLAENLLSSHGMIIASGVQGSMPHHLGHGLLQPHQPIIFDLFPQDRGTGYWADMTRTYVKGTPSAEVKKMYEAVQQAQQTGLETVRAGLRGEEVHEQVVQTFTKLGYPSRGEVGFIHRTGHGLGLDIHEDPNLEDFYTGVLEPGNVVTVEPGLYYPEHGGIRIEDVVVVTENGCENLTHYQTEWIIP